MADITFLNTMGLGADMRLGDAAAIAYGGAVTTDGAPAVLTILGSTYLQFDYNSAAMVGLVEIQEIGATPSTTDYNILSMVFAKPDGGGGTFDVATMEGLTIPFDTSVPTTNGIQLSLGLAGNDQIEGNAFADYLLGYGGNDSILGNGGNDTIDGGTGGDLMLGGAGNDTYYVDNVNDLVFETLSTVDRTDAGGIDKVISSISYTLRDLPVTGTNFNAALVENLTLTGTANLNGTGNTLNNFIVGNSGVNVLRGGAGNDTLSGGVGGDTMFGGAGNDVYVVDTRFDKVYETTTATGTTNAGGLDRVDSFVTWTLGAYVENLTLKGAGAINGTGNGLNNALVGNAAANSLSGLAGADALNGGLGNDTLDGGTGQDVFVFNTVLGPGNVDRINAFVAADDTIRLENAIFTQLLTTGALSAANFRASATGNAADANDYILYNTGTGALFYDADGSGAGAKVQFATLWSGATTHPTLTAADFVVS